MNLYRNNGQKPHCVFILLVLVGLIADRQTDKIQVDFKISTYKNLDFYSVSKGPLPDIVSLQNHESFLSYNFMEHKNVTMYLPSCNCCIE